MSLLVWQHFEKATASTRSFRGKIWAEWTANKHAQKLAQKMQEIETIRIYGKKPGAAQDHVAETWHELGGSIRYVPFPACF